MHGRGKPCVFFPKPNQGCLCPEPNKVVLFPKFSQIQTENNNNYNNNSNNNNNNNNSIQSES